MQIIDCEKDKPCILDEKYQVSILEINEDEHYIVLEIMDVDHPEERSVRTLQYDPATSDWQLQIH